MADRHKVFISFHSDDIAYKKEFERLFHDQYEVMISYSVQEKDIASNIKTETVRQKIRDEYLRDSTVTVVLIGQKTWQRKHVDWEISSSIRDTYSNPRSGLFGILLPTHPSYLKDTYDAFIIPPRLFDNAKCGFATIHDWTNDPVVIQNRIHAAFLRRDKILPDNSRNNFVNNRNGDNWQD